MDHKFNIWSLNELDGGRLTVGSWIRHTNVCFWNFQILIDHLEVGFTVRVQSLSPAHDYETLKVPLVKDVTAVVESRGIVCEQHNIPVLHVRQSAVIANKHEWARLRDVVSGHGCSGPNLGSVHSLHAENGRIVDLTIFNREGRLLTLVAVVERVETAHDIPQAVQLVILHFLNCFSGVAASRIVQRIWFGEWQALVIHIKALHHIICNCRRVAQRALDCTCGVHWSALACTAHVLSASRIAYARSNLSSAVACDAGSVLDWKGAVVILGHETLKEGRNNLSTFIVWLYGVDHVLNGIDNVINWTLILVKEIDCIIKDVW